MARSIIQIRWKDILGYEGLYQISDTGEVRSMQRWVNQGAYGNKRHLAILGKNTLATGKKKACLG